MSQRFITFDRHTLCSWTVYTLLGLPASRNLLESHPSLHMIVQLPLLIVCGYYFIPRAADHLVETIVSQLDPKGVLGFLAIVFTVLFWMIPRSLDGAIDDQAYELGKFLSLPLFVGLPLRYCWPMVTQVLRGFFIAQFIAMLAFLGWLYTAAPIRICNNYLEGAQQELGRHLFLIAILMALSFGLSSLLGNTTEHTSQPPRPKGAQGTSHV